jgi:hypothetical protein
MTCKPDVSLSICLAHQQGPSVSLAVCCHRIRCAHQGRRSRRGCQRSSAATTPGLPNKVGSIK